MAKKTWCIPPEQNAAFVCAMENVLEVYHRPYVPKRPVICFDEKSKQLVAEVRRPIAAGWGRAVRYDYEYERNGTANLFVLVEPLKGWRQVTGTPRRCKADFAGQMRELVDVHDRKAEKITVVMDNLNTHALSSLYAAFTPVEARRLMDKLDVVHTPKHESWLNMAEIEFSVMEKQAIKGRIPDEKALTGRVKAWETDRNHHSKRINRQFTADDARIKLRRLYPQIES